MKKIKITLVSFFLLFSAVALPVNVAAASSTWLTAAAKAVWKVARAASSTYWNRTPTLTYGSNWVRSGTGSIELNNGTNGATIKNSLNIGKANLYLETWAQTDWAHMFTDAIVITLLNPKNDVVYSKNCDHNQRMTYNSKAPYGTYTILFTDNEKRKWDCYFQLTDYNVSRSVTSAYDKDGNIVGDVYRAENGKNYMFASEAHANSLEPKSVISFSELGKQNFDEELGTYVYDLKDYKIGDRVIIQDEIQGIEYDELKDNTKFTFVYGDSEITWMFKGDLTHQYYKGQKIKFNLKVVPEIEGNDDFEVLDIIKEVEETRTAPSIEKYVSE